MEGAPTSDLVCWGYGSAYYLGVQGLWLGVIPIAIKEPEHVWREPEVPTDLISLCIEFYPAHHISDAVMADEK